MSNKIKRLIGVATLVLAITLGILWHFDGFGHQNPIQRSEMTDKWVVYRIDAAPGTFKVYNSPGDGLHPIRMDSLAFRMTDDSEVKVAVKWDLPTSP
jgi:hypothetical protein